MAAGHLAGDLGMVRDVNDSHVRWVEGPAHVPVLKVAPIDVGGALAEKLWPEHTAILTSATIPSGLAGRVGIAADDHDELDAGSPFDFETQALLYCATHMPDPRNDTYRDALHDELAFLIDAAGGRTLALFTSCSRWSWPPTRCAPPRRADPRPGRPAQAQARRRVRRTRSGVPVRHDGLLAGRRRTRVARCRS